MNKQELFKAAHRLAKAYQVENGGDYIVYLVFALKAINANIRAGGEKAGMFKAMNKRIAKVSASLPLICREVKEIANRGLKEFDAMYKMEAAHAELKNGEFFGKAFEKAGKVCAWVRVEIISEVAY